VRSGDHHLLGTSGEHKPAVALLPRPLPKSRVRRLLRNAIVDLARATSALSVQEGVRPASPPQ
jgi:hypothetical protein